MFPAERKVTPIIRRFGLKGFGPWRGINRQNDRGALHPAQFFDLVNLRNSGGSWDVRGGTSAPINVNAFVGCVTGIIDMPGATAGILANAVTTDLNPYGSDIITLYDPNDPDDTTYLTPLNMSTFAAQIQETLPRRGMARFNDQIYFVNGATGLSVLSLATSPGQTLTDSRSVTPVVTLPYEANYITTAFGLLWITTAQGEVYTWDGTTLTTIVEGISATPAVICQYQEFMYIVASDYFARYNPDGTLTAISLPAHTGTFQPRCITWCQDVNKLYFGGNYFEDSVINDPVLFSYDGTTVTEVFTLAEAVANPADFFDGVMDVVEWDGVATFIWHKWGVDLTGEVYIGTVASPTAVPIGDTSTTNAVGVSLFVDANDQLYAGINAEWDAGAENRIIRRDGTSLGGYWHTDANKSGWTAIGADGTWGIGGTDLPCFQMFSQI